ncbi:MAG: AraC-like DNA-binding protein [Polyangiales bacterium]|jgi:AraC-like DNA-binding protein
MDLEHLSTLARQWLLRTSKYPDTPPPLRDVFVLSSSVPTPLSPTLYQPVICLILQGGKEVLLGDATFHLGRGDALVVSHDVPVVARITAARPGEPYLAIILSLDISTLRSLYEEAGGVANRASDSRPHAMASTAAGPRLVDAMARYLALADDEVESRILASAVRREIHYRLLMAPKGGMLRSLLRHDSHASKVSGAISLIRAGFRETLAVPDLAREVGMSVSSLHKHFRAITATTPLQFQKDLRLLEARRLLVAGQHAVSDVAYEVGYESPNQFSREYSRKFGASPRSDLRTGLTATG